MNQSKISVRYAKALYQFSKEKNELDKVKNDMALLENTCKIPDFKLALDSPQAKPLQKLEFIKALFSGKISETTLSFINLVVSNKRDAYLEDMARQFLYVYRKDQGIKKVTVTTAKKINTEQRNKILSFVESNYNVNADIEERVDQSIIGGLILRIEDQQLDSSVSNKLKKIKQALFNVKV